MINDLKLRKFLHIKKNSALKAEISNQRKIIIITLERVVKNMKFKLKIRKNNIYNETLTCDEVEIENIFNDTLRCSVSILKIEFYKKGETNMTKKKIINIIYFLVKAIIYCFAIKYGVFNEITQLLIMLEDLFLK